MKSSWKTVFGFAALILGLAAVALLAMKVMPLAVGPGRAQPEKAPESTTDKRSFFPNNRPSLIFQAESGRREARGHINSSPW